MDAQPGDRRPTPGRLEHAPARRYRPSEPPLDTSGVARQRRSAARRASLVAIAFGVMLALLAGGLALTSGLVFVSGVGGAAVGLVLAGGDAAGGGAVQRRTRLAVLLALAMVALGLAGTWIVARAEGGVLGPLEYAWTVFGVLPALQVAVAGLAAAWGVANGPIRWRA